MYTRFGDPQLPGVLTPWFVLRQQRQVLIPQWKMSKETYFPQKPSLRCCHNKRQKSETIGFSPISVLCTGNLQVVQFITLISTSAFVEIHTLEDYHFTSSDDAIKDILCLHDWLSRQSVRKYSLLVTSQLLLHAACHTNCLLFWALDHTWKQQWGGGRGKESLRNFTRN